DACPRAGQSEQRKKPNHDKARRPIYAHRVPEEGGGALAILREVHVSVHGREGDGTLYRDHRGQLRASLPEEDPGADKKESTEVRRGILSSGGLNGDLILPLRPFSTYSVVALDTERGEVGVAVQSHWFTVGSVVTWAEAGGGAGATESFVEASYAPPGLALMQLGYLTRLRLKSLLGRQKNANTSQVALISSKVPAA